MDNLNIPNEELWNAFERLKAENYHLKRQLKNKNDLMRGKDKFIKKLLKEQKEWAKEKNHYKNGKRDNYKRDTKKR